MLGRRGPLVFVMAGYEQRSMFLEEMEMVSVGILLFVLGLVLIWFRRGQAGGCFGGFGQEDWDPADCCRGYDCESIGTTLPEILVSTTAAFDGSAAISAGMRLV